MLYENIAEIKKGNQVSGQEKNCGEKLMVEIKNDLDYLMTTIADRSTVPIGPLLDCGMHCLLILAGVT